MTLGLNGLEDKGSIRRARSDEGFHPYILRMGMAGAYQENTRMVEPLC